jgi:hypothetical protein
MYAPETEEICLLYRQVLGVIHNGIDRTVAQAFSRWIPTAAAIFRAPVKSCGICR